MKISTPMAPADCLNFDLIAELTDHYTWGAANNNRSTVCALLALRIPPTLRAIRAAAVVGHKSIVAVLIEKSSNRLLNRLAIAGLKTAGHELNIRRRAKVLLRSPELEI